MTVLQIIFTLIRSGVLSQLIQAAELAFPASGSGASKLGAVVQHVGAYVAAVPQIADQAQAVATAVAPHVSALVSLFNALQAWQPSSSSASSPASSPA